ncbi:MAG: hypothetical protein OXC44_02495 [Proteobacteria bacterium]|nr:hypothetical protein [Pseudomonadota bacterium]
MSVLTTRTKNSVFAFAAVALASLLVLGCGGKKAAPDTAAPTTKEACEAAKNKSTWKWNADTSKCEKV